MYFFNVIFSIFNKGIFNSDLKLNSDHFLHIVRKNTNHYRFQIKNLFEINSNKQENCLENLQIMYVMFASRKNKMEHRIWNIVNSHRWKYIGQN